MSDFPVQLIEATVQLDQPLPGGVRTVGTGFLVASTSATGEPRTILVTAKHVLAGMPGEEANIGYRAADAGGTWRYAPQAVKIRDETGEPLWTGHPARDVAAMVIEAPPEFAKAAIPAGYLAAGDAYAERNISPGDEMMVLGYPRGVASNNAGFPILRSGKVASYPVSPKVFPTFLLDFSVFPGNSGGPVFITRRGAIKAGGTATAQPLITGILTQQVQMNDERLEIGIVIHSKYVLETLDLLGDVRAPVTLAQDETPVRGAQPAAEVSRTPSPLERSFTALERQIGRYGAMLWTPWEKIGVRLAGLLAPLSRFAGAPADEARQAA